jgi:hypothetical protein
VIGLSLAPQCEWVRCSDANPPHAAFEASRQLLPPATRPRITYAVGSAAERLADAAGANVAVVDPPRKGLDPPLLDALCALRLATPDTRTSGASFCAGITTLVYISCGFPALAREATRLLESGWTVTGQRATAHVLFPGANHIETVVVFERPGLPSSDVDVSVLDDGPPHPDSSSGTSRPPSRRAGSREARRRRDPSTPRGRRLAARRKRAAAPPDGSGLG